MLHKRSQKFWGPKVHRSIAGRVPFSYCNTIIVILHRIFILMSNYDRGVGRIYSVFTKKGVRSKFFQIPKSFASPIKIPVGASGLDWTGLDWTGLDWTGLDWTGLDWTGLDWTGLDWTGLDWTGLDWTGLDWTGLDWTGLDWTGLPLVPRYYTF